MASNAELQIILRLKDEATKSLGDFNKNLDNSSKMLKVAGGAMIGFSAALATGMGFAIKAGAEEEASITRLATAVNAAGLAWDKTGASLEAFIDRQMQMTGYADDDQRQALASLIAATGNLTAAQNLLTTAMDLARWKNIDLVTASDLLMRVYAGNMSMLTRYGIIINEGASATDALRQVQQMAAGQAEAYGKTTSGQLEILKNNFNDLKEQIGGALLPTIQPLVENITSFIRELRDADPAMVQAVAQLALFVTPLLAVGGGFAVLVGFLPQLKTGLILLNGVLETTAISIAGVQIALWEVTLLVVGLTMLAYGLWLLWRNKIQGEVLDPDMWVQLAKDIGGAIKPLTGALLGNVADEMKKVRDAVNVTGAGVDTKLTPAIVKTGNAARYSVEAFNEWYAELQAAKDGIDEYIASMEELNREIEINNALTLEQTKQAQKAWQAQSLWNFDKLFQSYGVNADDIRRIMANGLYGQANDMEAAVYEILMTNDIDAAGGGGMPSGGYNPNLNVTVQIDGEQVAAVTSVQQGSDVNQRARMGG